MRKILIKSTNWVEQELQRKKDNNEPIINVFEIAEQIEKQQHQQQEHK